MLGRLPRACGARKYGPQCQVRTLICGAAGVLKGRKATTHWAVDLLSYFGATPVNERVVVDGNPVSAAGITSGIDALLMPTRRPARVEQMVDGESARLVL